MKYEKSWNKSSYEDLLNYLILQKDSKYLEFSKKLITTNYNMIGIRIPILRSIAKDLKNTNFIELLDLMKLEYHEEIILYGLLLNEIMDEETFFKYFEKILPYIDNWATSDLSLSKFKFITKNKDKYFKYFIKLSKNKKEYYSRVGYDMLLSTYVSDEYISDILSLIDNDIRELYYVNMSKAWLLCDLFIKYKNETLEYLKVSRLDKFTFNKAISKMCDSFRVSNDSKELLRKMRK